MARQLTLTPEQWTDVERFQACVVPGEWDSEIFTASDGQPAIRMTTNPPEQFRVANEPCPTCGGDGRRWDCEDTPMAGQGSDGRWVRCSAGCHGGKPVVELRVPCPHPYHDRTRLDGGWAVCVPGACNGGYITVARATVTLLPVHSSAATADGPHHDHVYIIGGLIAYLYRDRRTVGAINFDPLPVAGRDWVAVFEVVDA